MTSDDASESVLANFCSLFQGRLDAYGTEEGGCLRADPASKLHFMDAMDRHLCGRDPVGVYPMVEQEDGWVVHWGCVDFDEGEDDSYVYACNLQLVLTSFGIEGWIERSRSKGYHVWVFFHDWVPASAARHALYAACEIAGAPTKEVNPKQESLKDGKIGNYVRLPYPDGYNHQGHRRVVISDGDELSLDEFVWSALQTRTHLEELQPLIDLYKPPRPPRDERKLVIPPMDDNRPWEDRMDWLTRKVWAEGPLEGMDRSGTLWKLAARLEEHGWDPDEARQIIYDADQRWGKFTERDEVEYLDSMIDKVWRL